MDIFEMRKQFAAVLNEMLSPSLPVPRNQIHKYFMERLCEVNESLYDVSKIKDRSLNAAWNFCDDYFDCVVHGLNNCGNVPMSQANVYLMELVAVLESGREIQNPEIMRFYRND